MTIYLLDTNMISEIALRPDGRVEQRFAAEADDCLTSIIVAAEIRFGLARRSSSRRARRAIEILDQLAVVDFATPAENHYAKIRTELERKGTPIGANDLFIAAHALALNATLVTANEREFGRVPGLKVENWAA